MGAAKAPWCCLSTGPPLAPGPAQIVTPFDVIVPTAMEPGGPVSRRQPGTCSSGFSTTTTARTDENDIDESP